MFWRRSDSLPSYGEGASRRSLALSGRGRGGERESSMGGGGEREKRDMQKVGRNRENQCVKEKRIAPNFKAHKFFYG